MSKLVKDLKKFESTFGELSKKFILDSGALLGYMRNGDYVPNDTDLDLNTINKEAFLQVAKAVEKIPGVGFYRYKGELYKILIPKHILGTSNYIDVQYFQIDSEYYFNYAIGRRGGAGRIRAKGKIKIALSLLSEFLKRNFDPGYFPLSTLYYHDQWIVPIEYFDYVQNLNGLSVVRPSNVSQYLTFRYGNWEKPAEEWISHRDDRGYRKSNDNYMSSY